MKEVISKDSFVKQIIEKNPVLKPQPTNENP